MLAHLLLVFLLAALLLLLGGGGGLLRSRELGGRTEHVRAVENLPNLRGIHRRHFADEPTRLRSLGHQNLPGVLDLLSRLLVEDRREDVLPSVEENPSRVHPNGKPHRGVHLALLVDDKKEFAAVRENLLGLQLESLWVIVPRHDEECCEFRKHTHCLSFRLVVGLRILKNLVRRSKIHSPTLFKVLLRVL